jgi:hypothetical protein
MDNYPCFEKENQYYPSVLVGKHTLRQNVQQLTERLKIEPNIIDYNAIP